MSETPISTTANRTDFATAHDYFELLKPRIIMLVVFTGLAGLVAAQSMTGVTINPVMAVIATLAIAMGSGAAGAINMWYDSDIDARMARTAVRPIPSGVIPREEALTMGLILSGVSVLLMWMSTNLLAAGLLGLSIAYYGWFYTMLLKRRTSQNIVIGGAAGAFPPVIGWAAVTGTTPLDAWILFAIIFIWTPPHFWALSLVAHKDYEAAGVPMLPVTEGAAATRLQILLYTILLALVGVAPVLTGLGGLVYAVTAGASGAFFLWQSLRLWRSRAGEADAGAPERKMALGTFGFSILYLFLVFGALMIEHGFGLHWAVPGVSS